MVNKFSKNFSTLSFLFSLGKIEANGRSLHGNHNEIFENAVDFLPKILWNSSGKCEFRVKYISLENISIFKKHDEIFDMTSK